MQKLKLLYIIIVLYIRIHCILLTIVTIELDVTFDNTIDGNLIVGGMPWNPLNTTAYAICPDSTYPFPSGNIPVYARQDVSTTIIKFYKADQTELTTTALRGQRVKLYINAPYLM